MHLFGAMGSLMFIIGFISGYIGVSKLYHMFMNMHSLVTNNPWFFIALTTMVMGTQLFLAGFLAKSFYEQRATKNVIKFQVRLIYNMPSPDSSEILYAGVQHKRL
jgi:hypothetical protein